jgi:diguanylate cyclase (GGDEF)-like protein/PAS domain S-box-containing protein
LNSEFLDAGLEYAGRFEHATDLPMPQGTHAVASASQVRLEYSMVGSFAAACLSQFRQLFDAMPDIAVRGCLADGTLTYWNAAAERLYGYRADEALGQSQFDLLLGPDSGGDAGLAVRRACSQGMPMPLSEHALRSRDGRVVVVLATQMVFDEPGHALELYSLDVDITARAREESRLRLAEMVFERSREGIIIADRDRNIIKVNPAFTAITGYTEAEVLGRNPRLLSSGQHDESFYRDMWSTIESTGSWLGEVWNRRKDGSVYAEALSIARVCASDGQVQHYISIIRDITERKRAEEQIQRLAHHDPLTGLPNRALLADRASQALSLARRVDVPLALMYLDLDHFKGINDSLGHRVGDLLLIEVARRLLSAVREQDTVSRQGGDEFVLALPGTGVDGAAHVAEKVRDLIAEPMIIEGHVIAVSTSIGIAMFPNDADEFEALSRAADIAMYRAKREGRNTWRFHAQSLEAAAATEVGDIHVGAPVSN